MTGVSGLVGSHVAQQAAGRFDVLGVFQTFRPSRLSCRLESLDLTDASAAADPFLVAPEAGWLARAIAWARRRLIGGDPKAGGVTAVAEAFSDDPSAAVWVYDGFSAASEEQMAREIVSAIERAHDAGGVGCVE